MPSFNKMNNEHRYLIELTREYLNNSKIVLKENINYNILFSIALKHNLLSVVYCAISNAENKQIINQDLLNVVAQKFYNIIYIGNLQSQIAEQLKEILNDAKVRFVLFKGAEIKNLYPTPESRTMGDIDVLIDEKNRRVADKALINAGFKCTDSNGPVWNYKKDRVLVEVHTQLLNESIDLKKVADGFNNAINNAVYNGFEGHFDDTYHFEYLMAHTAHHFRFYGAGIKLVLDLAIMLKYGKTDLNKAMQNLKQIGLDKFAKEIISVCFMWYGLGIQYNKDVSKTEEFLVLYGAFGGTGRDNSAVITRKNIESGKSTSPFIMKMRLAFPSYDKLKNIPYIKFINGRPWLTPYAWIYRFYYNLKNKKYFMVRTAKGLGNKESLDAAASEYNYFKEIGLL